MRRSLSPQHTGVLPRPTPTDDLRISFPRCRNLRSTVCTDRPFSRVLFISTLKKARLVVNQPCFLIYWWVGHLLLSSSILMRAFSCSISAASEAEPAAGAT